MSSGALPHQNPVAPGVDVELPPAPPTVAYEGGTLRFSLPGDIADPATPAEAATAAHGLRFNVLELRWSRGGATVAPFGSLRGVHRQDLGARSVYGPVGDGAHLELERVAHSIYQRVWLNEAPALPGDAEGLYLEIVEAIEFDRGLVLLDGTAQRPLPARFETDMALTLATRRGNAFAAAMSIGYPAVLDAEGRRVDSEADAHYFVDVDAEGRGQLITRVAASYLASAATRYPLAIDPEISSGFPGPRVWTLNVAPRHPGSETGVVMAVVSDLFNGPLAGQVNWGDGTVVDLTRPGAHFLQHDYGGAGYFRVTIDACDEADPPRCDRPAVRVLRAGVGARDCSAFDDDCRVGQYDEGVGDCVLVPRADGTVCDDGDFCSVTDVCGAGVCGGTRRVCALDDDACNLRCPAICGDGVRALTEPCDDGNRINEDACTNACTIAVCGDGIVGPGDACDDGNDVDTDACTNACTIAVCGDGITGPGEQCDDGNDIDGDLCTNACTVARCGDGIPGPGEECDDGNDVDTDACTNACNDAVCGDGIHGPGEQCDDGNDVDTDACTIACTIAVCGDGITGPGEQCDDGNDVNTDACTNVCADAVCGDGFTGPGEECDDGNGVDTDACTNACTLAVCGDGITGPGEQCDDGNRIDTDACTNACTLAVCGDGITGPGEQCDDGNGVDTDACTNACNNAVCGDGITGPGEQCDDANDVDTDACTNACNDAVCGDGITGPGEECDDGDNSNTDACTNACTLAVCGDGFTGPGEQCDDGGESAACNADCSPASCGDGQINASAGEACDDGNSDAGDGCDNCQITFLCGNGVVEPAGGEECDDGNSHGGDHCGATCQLDSDGDTISDADEVGDDDLATPPPDTDRDGVPDYLDPDSDGDGIPDADEAGDADLSTPPVDSSGEGLADFRDLDSDAVGITCLRDVFETAVDTDGDGEADYMDPDNDGDGTPDCEDIDTLESALVFVGNRLTFWDAQAYCEANFGTSLVSLPSVPWDDAAAALAERSVSASGAKFWLGGAFQGTYLSWVDGRYFGYSNFSAPPNQQFLPFRDCVAGRSVRDFQGNAHWTWNADYCWDRNRFFCWAPSASPSRFRRVNARPDHVQNLGVEFVPNCPVLRTERLTFAQARTRCLELDECVAFEIHGNIVREVRRNVRGVVRLYRFDATSCQQQRQLRFPNENNIYYERIQ